MRIKIIYASKHGTTEKVAGLIAEKLMAIHKVELISLKKNANPDLSDCEIVVLGTSIYAGKASGKMKAFCKANESALLLKRMGLFVCGMEPDQAKREQELKDAYSEELLKGAAVTGFLGGELLFEQMNFFERLIISKIAKTKKTVHQIDLETINVFVEKLWS